MTALSPATRDSIQKNWSAVIAGSSPGSTLRGDGGRGPAEEEGGARRSVDLVPVVHLEDLDVEIRIERPRRLAHQDGEKVDAEAHIAGFHDPRLCRRFLDPRLVGS